MQKKKIEKKELSPIERIIKAQGQLPKTSLQIDREDNIKSRWNPSALYF